MRVLYNRKRSIATFLIVTFIASIMLMTATAHALYPDNSTNESENQDNIDPSNTSVVIDEPYIQANLVATIQNPYKSIIEIASDENMVSDSSDEEINIEEPDTEFSEVVHIVSTGDSWWSIANKYYGNGKYYKALAAYNNRSYNKDIYAGEEIIIPDFSNHAFQNIYTNESLYGGTLTSSLVMYSGPKTEYKYGTRSNPAVDITIPSNGSSMKNYTGEVDTSNYEALGTYKITGYTPGCVHCCGNDKGIGAAGVEIICGYSVAAPSSIPLGTTLYIEDYGYYVVEDRGAFGNGVIDIACPDHDSCGPVTANGINVYIVPNN